MQNTVNILFMMTNEHITNFTSSSLCFILCKVVTIFKTLLKQGCYFSVDPSIVAFKMDMNLVPQETQICSMWRVIYVFLILCLFSLFTLPSRFLSPPYSTLFYWGTFFNFLRRFGLG